MRRHRSHPYGGFAAVMNYTIRCYKRNIKSRPRSPGRHGGSQQLWTFCLEINSVTSATHSANVSPQVATAWTLIWVNIFFFFPPLPSLSGPLKYLVLEALKGDFRQRWVMHIEVHLWHGACFLFLVRVRGCVCTCPTMVTDRGQRCYSVIDSRSAGSP